MIMQQQQNKRLKWLIETLLLWKWYLFLRIKNFIHYDLLCIVSSLHSYTN